MTDYDIPIVVVGGSDRLFQGGVAESKEVQATMPGYTQTPIDSKGKEFDSISYLSLKTALDDITRFWNEYHGIPKDKWHELPLGTQIWIERVGPQQVMKVHIMFRDDTRYPVRTWDISASLNSE